MRHITLDITDEQYDYIRRACVIQDISEQAFARKALADEALAVLDKYYIIRATVEQADKFIAALDAVEENRSKHEFD